MNREEFQRMVSDRFQNTDSGFGNMTQRELILLQIASSEYEKQVKNGSIPDVVGRFLNMRVSETKIKLRHKDQDKVVICQFINQATTDLIGGIWTDKYGKIHYVGLVRHENGVIMPDFPNMQEVYIADVAQVGLLR